MPKRKKKEEPETTEIIEGTRKERETRTGGKIISEKVLEARPRLTSVGGKRIGTQFKTRDVERRFSPSALRVLELSKGEGFLGQGTPEYKQFLKEFPLGVQPEPDPELHFRRREQTEIDRLATRVAQTPQQAIPSELLQQMTPEQREEVLAAQQRALSTGVKADELSYEQAIKSALAGAGAGIIGGAVAGGIAGAPAGGFGAIPGAIGGAVIGALGGFVAGFRSNLKTQRADMLKGEAANLLKQEQNLLKIVMNTNQGGDAVTNLGHFNNQMSLITENHSRLKLESSDDLSKWLGEDGHKQLEKYEIFYSPGGMRDILVLQMQQAILNPDPNKNLLGIQDVVKSEAGEGE